MHIPQYMHNPQSMVNSSRTATVRGRRASESGTDSLWASMVMHQAGHARAQMTQEVQASTSRSMAECLMLASLVRRSIVDVALTVLDALPGLGVGNTGR